MGNFTLVSIPPHPYELCSLSVLRSVCLLFFFKFSLHLSFALFRFTKHRGGYGPSAKEQVQNFYSLDHQTLTSPLRWACDVCKWVSTYEWGWYELWSMDEHTRGWGKEQCSKGGRVLLQSRKSACIRIWTPSLLNISHMQPPPTHMIGKDLKNE
jgi:hypothetical protein